MPISARWRKLDALPPRRGRDAEPGVYELANAKKQVVYIGQSTKDVPNRIRQHLGKNLCITNDAVYWRSRYSRVPRSEEAALLRHYLTKYEALPPCNRALQRVRGANARYLERSGSE